MGAWGVSITGNDTAQDLKSEYTSAFYYYEVPEALRKIHEYVRAEGFDESDPEEWCDYYYSLADFMWKKGILTEEIKQKTLAMIDEEFGLEVWAESGEKTLKARKKVLEQFKDQLLSPQPKKKKIRPDAYTKDYFDVGDIIAIQLRTAGKTYAKFDEKPMDDEKFYSYDGKYILIQKIKTCVSWESAIVPEVKDHWLVFRLFDGIYDEIPTQVEISELQDAKIHGSQSLTPLFTCGSSLFYFRKRKYQILGNSLENIDEYANMIDEQISLGVDKPWCNPDSSFLAAMGKEISCQLFDESMETLKEICRNANLYGRYEYSWSREKNDERFQNEENVIFSGIDKLILDGGKVYSVSFGHTVGIITVHQNKIEHFYVVGRYQNIGLGTALLKYVINLEGSELYIEVPVENKKLKHVCEKVGMSKSSKKVKSDFDKMIIEKNIKM